MEQSGSEWAAQDLRNRVKAAMSQQEKDKEAVKQARKEARLKEEKKARLYFIDCIRPDLAS